MARNRTRVWRFVWGDLKGSRVLRGISEKRKVQWHFGISSQYHGGFVRYFRVRTRLLFSEDGKTRIAGKTYAADT